MDLELYQEPVEVDEAGGDVLPGFGSRENRGSRVLHLLEHVQGFTGKPKQDFDM